MKNATVLFLAILFLLVGPNTEVFGQSQLSISGKAKDAEGKAVEFADILLLKQDSSVYKLSFIEDGQFRMDQIDSGQYILHINALDWEPLYQNLSLKEDTNLDFVLQRRSIALDEIAISARRKIFENKEGNVLFNIANTILKAEPNPISILSKLPYVQISPDGASISVVGRGTALIYHNNQRIDLNRLNSFSVDDLESIEIINNPSAKYEAEGRSVILIRTKKNLPEGYKVDLSETLTQRELPVR